MRFLVNLSDRLDTGLFLDHRNTRARVREESAGKRVLNLFAYTGSFTVAAATGGARSTTSVDLSATYLDWAGRNLALNGVRGAGHDLVRADCLRWLDEARGRWDLVVLDPPPHSTSKGMRGDFNVQRDHRRLLGACWAFSPGRSAVLLDQLQGIPARAGGPPGPLRGADSRGAFRPTSTSATFTAAGASRTLPDGGKPSGLIGPCCPRGRSLRRSSGRGTRAPLPSSFLDLVRDAGAIIRPTPQSPP
jgi:hypothetical protein